MQSLLMPLAIALISTSVLGSTKTTVSISASKLSLPPAPEGVVIEQNVGYLSPEREEKLDLYLPANRPLGVRSPAVVIIHGGGWTGGDKAAGREFNIGTTLAKAGYVCASVNYSLAADNRWPTDLYDCKNAVRFLRANSLRYHIDSDHIGVIGGSAGGHLSLMDGYTSEVPELELTVSDRGQITLPAPMRKKLGIKSRSKVNVEIRDSEIVIRPAKSDLLAELHRRFGPPAPWTPGKTVHV